MKSSDEQHISERQLVREAAMNPVARQLLKQALLPYVADATKKLMQKRGIPEHLEHELIEVGMAPFDRVFNIYLKNVGNQIEEEGFFYKYYIWWMRQAIVAHTETTS